MALVAPVVLAVNPPGDEVTAQPAIGLPPVSAGAIQVTVACPFPGTAATPVGAPGTLRGVTGAEGAEAGPVPTTLLAVTVSVYAVPWVRPATVALVAPMTLAVRPPGEEVTVYPVMALPPLDAGAVQLTLACALPAVAVTPVGAPGTPRGTIAADGADADPAPAALLAKTIKV